MATAENYNNEIKSSSLKNEQLNSLTAEEIIKKYEKVLASRENQVSELSCEIGKVHQKLENLKNTHEDCIEKNKEYKTTLSEKEELLKKELNNKEILFMQLTHKEQECDEIKKKIDDYKKDKKGKKNDKKNEKEKVEKKVEEKKEEPVKENVVAEKQEIDVKSNAKEKINQLKNKNDKKINFAELLKKSSENKEK